MDLILKRIGKTSDYYLVDTLDIKNNKIDVRLYDRNDSKFIDLDYSKMEFKDLRTDETIDIDNLSEKTIDLSDFKVLKFNYDSLKVRSLRYSFKKSDGEIFVPCCGKHVDNDNFRHFGKYIDDYNICRSQMNQ